MKAAFASARACGRGCAAAAFSPSLGRCRARRRSHRRSHPVARVRRSSRAVHKAVTIRQPLARARHSAGMAEDVRLHHWQTFAGASWRGPENRKGVEPRTPREPPPRGVENVPWPTPLSGRGFQGTASLQETWRFSREQRLDARASNRIVAAGRKRGGNVYDNAIGACGYRLIRQ